jgi:hypothetical protein
VWLWIDSVIVLQALNDRVPWSSAPSHHLLGFLDNANGAVAAPLALHALPGAVLLLQSGPAVSWSFGGRSALGPPGRDWSLRHGVVVLLVQGLPAGKTLFGCCRLRLGCLAAHATAVASVAVEEQKPYAHPDECNDRDDADDDEYGNGGSRDTSRSSSFEKARCKVGDSRHDVMKIGFQRLQKFWQRRYDIESSAAATGLKWRKQ